MDTVLELFEAREALKKQVADLRNDIKKIDDALKEKYMDKARTLLSHSGKDFGTVTFHDGNIVIKAFVEKKVEWDQEALARIFDSMPPEEAQQGARKKTQTKLTYSLFSTYKLHCQFFELHF